MGVSLNIVFQKKVPPYGSLSSDHNALGNGLERLDRLLTRAGLGTLGQFISVDPAEWCGMDEDDPDAADMPPQQWFQSTEGLAVVRAALDYLRTHPRAIGWSKDIRAELEQVETELTAAERRKVLFHFEICD